MSFYTSFYFCRPTKPPIVRGRELGQFIARLRELEIFDQPPFLPLKLKFGQAIDQDVKGTSVYVPVGCNMFGVQDIEWHIYFESRCLDDTLAELSRHDRPIYRAVIDLGTMREELRQYMNSTEGHGGNGNLHLGSWSFSIEPIQSFSLRSDERYMIGWMALTMSGNGYMHPLTLAELVRRAQSHPKLQAAARVCREMWPVTSGPVGTPLWWRFPSRLRRYAFDMQGGPPSRRTRRIRQEMGDLWAYPIDASFDWFWAVAESG